MASRRAQGLTDELVDMGEIAAIDSRADGLSTALCLLPADRIASALQRFPGARLEMLI